MHVYLRDHFIFLAASVIAGCILSFIYDVLRILRIARGNHYAGAWSPDRALSSFRMISFYESKRKIKNNERTELVLYFFEDIFFSLIVCLFMLLLVYGYNYGKVRLFSVMGMILGFYLWRFTIGKVVIILCEYLIYLFRVILYYIFYPLNFLIVKIKKVIYKSIKLLYNKTVGKFAFRKKRKSDDRSSDKKTRITVNTVYMERK